MGSGTWQHDPVRPGQIFANKSGRSVDRVRSTLSWKQYARKRVFKGGEAEHSKQAQRRLLSELKTLKGLEHQHLVKIVGSYTDTQYIAYIMTPVATQTLGDFLADKKSLEDGDMAMLRRFYGCLAAAVNYLHQSRVRHNDITRRNVLIKRGEVYIADFGSCHSWNTQAPLGSRTRHVTTGASPDYMAPEIARPDSASAPRGRAADMWSLGVLFLEMTTRLLGRSLKDLQTSLRRSASKISKPGFLYAVPQFAAEWMETLRQSSNISQHDNEPLQWIRVLLQKKPALRFTSATLMNRILDSPSFTEFHCFKCRDEFVNSQIVYQSHAPRFDPEDDSQAMMDTVGGVFGDDDDLYEGPPSKSKMSFIERWRAGTSVPVLPAYSDQDSLGEEEPVDDDAASLRTNAEDVQADYEPSMGAEQLLYGLGGQSSVPAYPQESPSTALHHEKANTAAQAGYDGSGYLWDSGSGGISDGQDGAIDRSDSGSKFVATPPISKDADPTALFEEAESASSDGAEDDTRMFEEISEKSDSGSDVSSVMGAGSTAPSDLEYDEVSSFGEVDISDGKTARIKAIDAGHGMFEEEEEVSASEPEVSPSEDGIALSEGLTRDITEAGQQEPRASSVESQQKLRESSVEKPMPAMKATGVQVAPKANQKARRSPQVLTQRKLADKSETQIDGQQHSETPLTVPGVTAAEDPASKKPKPPGSKPGTKPGRIRARDGTQIDNQHPETPLTVPGVTTAEDLASQKPESPRSKSEKKPGGTRVGDGTQKPQPARQAAAPRTPKPNSCLPPSASSSSSPTGQANDKPKSTPQSKNGGLTKTKSTNAASTDSANKKPSTGLRPKAVPSINIQPPDDGPAGPVQSPELGGVVPAPSQPLSKKNLKKITPKRPKKRDPVEQLNPASFLKITADNASSIATSVISDNTKKSIGGIGLPIKQADKLKDFLSLYCTRGKLAAVRWLLDEGCNPGTTKRRRAGPIVRAVRGGTMRHVRCVAELIRHEADVNVQTTKSGKTPLHFAVENDAFEGYEKLIWLLVENGARVDEKSRDGETALTMLFARANERAFERHHLQALAILLNAGARVNRTIPATGDLPLHMAVRNKDGWATAMLLHQGADVTAKNASGTTPIQVTAGQFRGWLTREHATVLNVILKYIATEDKRAVDERAGAQGRTALHLAVKSGTAQAVELLLAHGASPLVEDACGRDALHLALASAGKLVSTRPVEDHVEVMERLIKAAGREWPIDRGVCAVELACADGRLMKSLLDGGLGPNTIFKGASLLRRAERAGKGTVVEMLVEKGASSGDRTMKDKLVAAL